MIEGGGDSTTDLWVGCAATLNLSVGRRQEVQFSLIQYLLFNVMTVACWAIVNDTLWKNKGVSCLWTGPDAQDRNEHTVDSDDDSTHFTGRYYNISDSWLDLIAHVGGSVLQGAPPQDPVTISLSMKSGNTSSEEGP